MHLPYHPIYAMHQHVYHHAPGALSGVGHMIVSAVIHGLIYGVIFKIMHLLPLWVTIPLVIVIVGGLWYASKQRNTP